MNLDSGDEVVFPWLSRASLSELEMAAGEILVGDGLGVGSVDPGSKRRAFRAWLQEKEQEIQRRLCPTPIVRELTGNSAQDISAIATLLMPIATNHQLALLLAAILVRTGVTVFCTNWSDG